MRGKKMCWKLSNKHPTLHNHMRHLIALTTIHQLPGTIRWTAKMHSQDTKLTTITSTRLDPWPTGKKFDNAFEFHLDSVSNTGIRLQAFLITMGECHQCDEELRSHTSISSDCEGASSLRLPHILLIIIVFSCDNNFVSNQISRVEPHTKLPNHADISSSRERLHEGLSSRPCNCSKVVHQVWHTQGAKVSHHHDAKEKHKHSSVTSDGLRQHTS